MKPIAIIFLLLSSFVSSSCSLFDDSMKNFKGNSFVVAQKNKVAWAGMPYLSYIDLDNPSQMDSYPFFPTETHGFRFAIRTGQMNEEIIVSFPTLNHWIPTYEAPLVRAEYRYTTGFTSKTLTLDQSKENYFRITNYFNNEREITIEGEFDLYFGFENDAIHFKNGSFRFIMKKCNDCVLEG